MCSMKLKKICTNFGNFLFDGKENSGKQRMKREGNVERRVGSGIDRTAVTAKTQRLMGANKCVEFWKKKKFV